MLSVCIAIQFFGILFLFLCILYVALQKSSRLQVYMVLTLVCILINFFGYLIELRGETLQERMLAVRFSYLGKPFILMLSFMFMMEYFHIIMPNWLITVTTIFHTTITILVLTCDYQQLYYTSIGLTDEGWFPHLVLGHGVFYIMQMGVAVLYLLITFGVCINRIRRVRSVVERKQIECVAGAALCGTVGMAVYYSGVTGGYDCTLLGYLGMVLVLMPAVIYLDLLDPLTMARERVMDESPDGIIVADSEGRMLYANRQAKYLFRELEDKQRYCEVLERLDTLSDESARIELDSRVYRLFTRYIEQKGMDYGKIYLINDITESYRHAKQLEEQTRLANQANEAKSAFLANMSHEIRTPINAVIGLNEMIHRESHEENIQKYALDVSSAAKALLSIINDVLDLSKIESGKMQIIPVDYTLSSLVNDLTNMIAPRAKKKGLRFETKIDENLPEKLHGDDVRLRQVILNLLTNAVKYTAEGGFTLEMTGERKEDRILLNVSVSDTGQGIRREDMSRLFTAFERINEAQNRSVEGTGLGLTITTRLLKMMDSRLEVESEYGKGSVFHFAVYQDVRSDEPVGNIEQRIRQAVRDQNPGQESFTAPNARILLVDDNDMNRLVFCQLLKRTQVQITQASGGRECLALVREHAFDLIFMDHMMPDMDGVETFKALREMPDNLSAEAPVIILTANAISGAAEEYLAMGFDGYLSKPVVPAQLEETIRTRLPAELVHNAAET